MAKASAPRAFLISGFRLALPGGLLPLWGYHVHPELGIAGNYFPAPGVGMAGTMALFRYFAGRRRANDPPMAGCLVGLINSAVFESIGPAWDADRAGVTLRGGIYFGAGSVAASLVISRCFSEDMIGDTNMMWWLAACATVPAAASWPFRRIAAAEILIGEESTDTAATRDRRTVLAILFGLLLFFQFADEWSIAGWLLLAMYWAALTPGRSGAAVLVRLKWMPAGRLPGASAFCALFGGTALWEFC